MELRHSNDDLDEADGTSATHESTLYFARLSHLANGKQKNTLKECQKVDEITIIRRKRKTQQVLYNRPAGSLRGYTISTYHLCCPKHETTPFLHKYAVIAKDVVVKLNRTNPFVQQSNDRTSDHFVELKWETATGKRLPSTSEKPDSDSDIWAAAAVIPDSPTPSASNIEPHTPHQSSTMTAIDIPPIILGHHY